MRRRFDVQRFQRICGARLHRSRHHRGWYRRKLLLRLDDEITVQTLATYEQGTRRISLVRFVQIAIALDESPVDLLADVLEQMFDDPAQQRNWTIDLLAASELEDPRLRPLQRWARSRLVNASMPNDEPQFVRLDARDMSALAELCHMNVLELAQRLPRLHPAPTNAERTTS